MIDWYQTAGAGLATGGAVGVLGLLVWLLKTLGRAVARSVGSFGAHRQAGREIMLARLQAKAEHKARRKTERAKRSLWWRDTAADDRAWRNRADTVQAYLKKHGTLPPTS